jgi:hypothetical protein
VAARRLADNPSGPDGYRRILARPEETLRTGEIPPGAVKLEEIRLRIARRLAERE